MDVQKMQKELEHLLAEVHWIQQKLKNLPEENISCERDLPGVLCGSGNRRW